MGPNNNPLSLDLIRLILKFLDFPSLIKSLSISHSWWYLGTKESHIRELSISAEDKWVKRLFDDKSCISNYNRFFDKVVIVNLDSLENIPIKEIFKRTPHLKSVGCNVCINEDQICDLLSDSKHLEHIHIVLKPNEHSKSYVLGTSSLLPNLTYLKTCKIINCTNPIIFNSHGVKFINLQVLHLKFSSSLVIEDSIHTSFKACVSKLSNLVEVSFTSATRCNLEPVNKLLGTFLGVCPSRKALKILEGETLDSNILKKIKWCQQLEKLLMYSVCIEEMPVNEIIDCIKEINTLKVIKVATFWTSSWKQIPLLNTFDNLTELEIGLTSNDQLENIAHIRLKLYKFPYFTRNGQRGLSLAFKKYGPFGVSCALPKNAESLFIREMSHFQIKDLTFLPDPHFIQLCRNYWCSMKDDIREVYIENIYKSLVLTMDANYK